MGANMLRDGRIEFGPIPEYGRPGVGVDIVVDPHRRPILPIRPRLGVDIHIP